MAANGTSFVNMSGKTFGRLTVLDIVGKDGHGFRWRCLCACGNTHVAAGRHLRSGQTGSCGCLKNEARRQRASRHRQAIHGHRSPEWRAWSAMRTRCLNPRTPAYPRYGGRGISVCARWDVFENFLADMGPRPSAAHSLDRYPNNDGNYEPGNCRWATAKEQANNRSRPGSRISDAQVAEMRRLLASMSGCAVARRFGVSRTHLDRLLRRAVA